MTTETLLHYSRKPIALVAPATQRGDCRGDKPYGFWVSVEGEYDWRSWCEAEGYGCPADALCYRTRLARRASILRLDCVDQLLHFTSKYKRGKCCGTRKINWARVAKEYDGIIISPYQWDLRYWDTVGWYWSWDCASGCIWGKGAVSSIKLLEAVT